MLTRCQYKEDNGTLVKYKVRMVIRGDQQVEGEIFTASDLYAPVLKAQESRLISAIAAAEGCSVYKTDTSQAFLYAAWEMTWYISGLWTGGLNPYPKAIAFNSSRA